jgi:putative oxidoreductase
MEIVQRENQAIYYYNRLAGILNRGQSAFLLLIRLYIGYQCIIAGWGHLHNFDVMVQRFTDWHIPMPRINVAVSASTELVGGILLLVGFLSRLISIPLAFNFMVAILTIGFVNHGHDLFKDIWNDQSVLLNDTAFPFFATAILILLFGPGWYSIDGLIRCNRECRRTNTAGGNVG